MKFQTQYNRKDFPRRHEINTLPSATIPDQTMTIKQIMDRYARGLPLEGVKVPIYEGEDSDLPDPKTLDLAERQELKEQYQEELQELKEKERIRRLPKSQQNQKSPEKQPLRQLSLEDSEEPSPSNILKKPGVGGRAPENGPEGPQNSQ